MNYLVTVNNLYSYNLQSFYIQLSHISRLSIQNEIYMGLLIQELYDLLCKFMAVHAQSNSSGLILSSFPG